MYINRADFSIWENFLVRSWWVILFVLFCLVLFEQGLNRQKAEYSKLYQYWQELQTEYELAIAEQEELLLQVNSQSDPAYIELVLMQGLGLVPEDQTKIYFKPGISNNH